MKKSRVIILCLSLVLVGIAASPVSAAAGHGNGKAMSIPAFYDGNLLTIQFVEFPPIAEASLLAKNSAINKIYQSDQAVAAGFNFISVIDAIPGPGFNPVWQEVQITFNVAFTQYPSDDAIIAAAAAGDITLTPTTEVYRCPVVGYSIG